MTNSDDRIDGEAADSDDGRHARRGRNRDAVVEAMLELYREGNLAPGSDEIAARAGLSPRSLFRYFDDIDDLCRAAIERHQQRVLPLTTIQTPVSAPLAERIEALVEQRARVFEAIGLVGQVSRLRAPFQPLLSAELAQVRLFFRNQIKRLMDPELSAMRPEHAASVLAAVDVLCSFEAYQLLRHDQMLTGAKTMSVLVETIEAVFTRAR